MKYEQPYGTAEDSPYINGNPSTGTMGSIPPAASIENPQRELTNLITATGVTPNAGDLKQVAKAIQSQRMNYAADVGTVNALQVTLNPALSSYTVGLPLRVKVKITNTGPSTVNAGPGTVAIKKMNGANVDADDLPANSLVDLVFDGTNFQLINFGGGGLAGSDILETGKALHNVQTKYTTTRTVMHGNASNTFSVTAWVPSPYVKTSPTSNIIAILSAPLYVGAAYPYGPSIVRMTIGGIYGEVTSANNTNEDSRGNTGAPGVWYGLGVGSHVITIEYRRYGVFDWDGTFCPTSADDNTMYGASTRGTLILGEVEP